MDQRRSSGLQGASCKLALQQNLPACRFKVLGRDLSDSAYLEGNSDVRPQVAAGTLKVTVGKTFSLDEIVDAHRCMDENRAGGKIVVLS